MLDLHQVFSPTDLVSNQKEMVARLSDTRKPVVLSVKGNPVLVIQDVDTYREIMDGLDKTEGREHYQE